MKKQNPSSISDAVMDQIRQDKVHMKSRSYHMLLGIVSFGSVVLAGIALAYLFNIIFLWFRVLGADTMAYGARANLGESVASFPWWALVLAALLLAVAVLLVRQQGRVYRHKTVTIVLIVVACSMLLGSVLTFFDVGRSHTLNQPNGSSQGPGWQRNR